MKTSHAAALLLGLSGCGLGGQWLNGHPHPPPPVPYLTLWQAVDDNPAKRIRDSRACGGDQPDGYFPFADERNDSTPYNQHTQQRLQDWERCMLGKGYRFSGQCQPGYSNGRYRDAPACGAP